MQTSEFSKNSEVFSSRHETFTSYLELVDTLYFDKKNSLTAVDLITRYPKRKGAPSYLYNASWCLNPGTGSSASLNIHFILES